MQHFLHINFWFKWQKWRIKLFFKDGTSTSFRPKNGLSFVFKTVTIESLRTITKYWKAIEFYSETYENVIMGDFNGDIFYPNLATFCTFYKVE